MIYLFFKTKIGGKSENLTLSTNLRDLAIFSSANGLSEKFETWHRGAQFIKITTINNMIIFYFLFSALSNQKKKNIIYNKRLKLHKHSKDSLLSVADWAGGKPSRRYVKDRNIYKRIIVVLNYKSSTGQDMCNLLTPHPKK